MEHNRRRAFADVANLDAWHAGFKGQKKVDLHVHVAFGSARVGGGVDEKVRFRLSLKRAEVVVIIPDTEPARVDRSSVERGEAPTVAVKRVDRFKASNKAGGEAKFKIKAGEKGVGGEASATAVTGAAMSRERAVEVSQQSAAMVVSQSQTDNGDYRWIIKSAIEGLCLDGTPWEAKGRPRMRVVDTRRDRASGIEPSLRVEVRCLREDLEISEIESKEGQGWSVLRKAVHNRNRLAAAEALIRTRLFEAGLVTGPLDEPFAQLVLAEAVVEDD